MRKQAIYLAGTLLCWPFLAQAATALNYNYVQGDFILDGEIEIDTPFGSAEEDYDGWDIKGSVAIVPNVFLEGEYSQLEIDGGGGDIEFLSAGLGANVALPNGAAPLDLFGVLSYESIDADGDDGDGFGITAGIRWLPAQHIEIDAYGGYVDYGNVAGSDLDGRRFGIDALFNVTEQIALVAGYRYTELEADGGGAEVDFEFRNEISLGARIYLDV